MKILVIDGQGGGLAASWWALSARNIRIWRFWRWEPTAQPPAPCSRPAPVRPPREKMPCGSAAGRADVILGPVGIVIADAMLGEITPAMASAVGQSPAKRILVPVNQCDNLIAGIPEQSMSKFVQSAVELLNALISEQ